MEPSVDTQEAAGALTGRPGRGLELRCGPGQPTLPTAGRFGGLWGAAAGRGVIASGDPQSCGILGGDR
jgi:hypothetical protein